MLVPVVIHKDRMSDYGVTVPGLPGCFSAGESIDEALIHARQAIERHLEGMLEDGELLPEMLPVEAFQRRREYRGGIWFMVEINPSRLMSGAKRVNITLPERLLTQIDRAAAAENTSRSGFIAEAALARIAGARSDPPGGRKIARAGRKG
jgi:predicted RNase H-like HicB family nuclease